MARKRRKKKDEKKATSITPKTEVEEVIEEYTDHVSILAHEPISPPPEPIELPETKHIRYLGTVDRFIIKGPVTGKRYCFTAKDRTGTIVAIEDYEGLLQRVRPARKCCGGRSIPEQPYFGPV